MKRDIRDINRDKDLLFLESEKNMKENTTENGEFIPTFYAWKTLDSQKEIAEKLANITKEK